MGRSPRPRPATTAHRSLNIRTCAVFPPNASPNRNPRARTTLANATSETSDRRVRVTAEREQCAVRGRGSLHRNPQQPERQQTEQHVDDERHQQPLAPGSGELARKHRKGLGLLMIHLGQNRRRAAPPRRSRRRACPAKSPGCGPPRLAAGRATPPGRRPPARTPFLAGLGTTTGSPPAQRVWRTGRSERGTQRPQPRHRPGRLATAGPASPTDPFRPTAHTGEYRSITRQRERRIRRCEGVVEDREPTRQN